MLAAKHYRMRAGPAATHLPCSEQASVGQTDMLAVVSMGWRVCSSNDHQLAHPSIRPVAVSCRCRTWPPHRCVLFSKCVGMQHTH